MAEPKEKPGDKPNFGTRMKEVVMVKSGRPWREWIGRLAEHDAQQQRRPVSMTDTIDRALQVYAKSIDFPDPAPMRWEPGEQSP